jgi:hypothetical protein
MAARWLRQPELVSGVLAAPKLTPMTALVYAIF